MIGMLTGVIALMEADRCILDVNGVGYLVQASTRTLSALPAAPESVRLWVETLVREDAISLYGFAESAEHDWFRLLITVQGVGARVALNILSALGPADLIAAITGADRGSLTRAAGVGARLATRIITELQARIGGMPSGGAGAIAPVIVGSGAAADAVSALVNLGYRRPDVQAAIAKVQNRRMDAGLDVLVREALKDLSG